MAGVPRQATGEESEDWLLGYLASTDVGKDPKLNLATQKVSKSKKAKEKPKNGAGIKAAGSAVSNAAGHVTGILGIKRGMARRSSWAAPPSAQADIKQAAQAIQAAQAAQAQPSSDAPGPPKPAQGAAAAATAADALTEEALDAQLAGQHASTKLAFLQAGNIYHKGTLDAAKAAKEAAHDDMTSPSDNFHKWAMSAQPAHTSRRMSSSGGGLRPQNPSVPAPAGEPSKRRMSTSRISMSGRRQSMDYSELDAVKQRLTHAATLWAVADDEDEGETTDEEADDNTSAGSSPTASVAVALPPAAPVEVPAPSAQQKKGLFKMFSKGKG